MGRTRDLTEHADRHRILRVPHAREDQGEVWVVGVGVVHEQVGFGDAVPELDDLGVEAPQADALVALLAEDHRLAVLED